MTVKKTTSKFPKGWDDAKVRRVLSHYEKQTPTQAVIEDDLPYKRRRRSTFSVPVKLIPAVRKLLAKHAG
jgi:hypothetical protein